ncbi:MAG: MBL fold metallo-hydrolase [Anaerolineae bacterium]|nr:MBL fold metallo-hydrolase [Anaerolineae bacterium]MCO5186787.1 MBL fold metallo-hydrolase [Anaerolineae bacterium]MCO5194008.1 MBL fold metallo-hydrolase [Anaerolineae bacterium]MCO5196540.1 MBL fold metallo-hydrolase [Anaerolineae bacterium]MCO5206713.1 MBL fold metallo-hydrolase [Anaerolineae bacterium]
MIRERIADDIYVFTSKRYAQVTAGAILTKDGIVLIDTLFYPDESRAIRDFLQDKLGHRVRYVINTHYHADHTTGTCLFPQATVISHALCRDYLDDIGRSGLEQMKQQYSEFADIEIVLPNLIIYDGTLDINIGGKTLRMMQLPGHSADVIGVFVDNNSTLFASDTMMPVPTVFDGNFDDMIASMKKLLDYEPETIVQGHGEVILRGEIERAIQDNIDYLHTIRSKVAKLVAAGKPESALDSITVESCGKSRIALNGLVTELHYANLLDMYRQMTEQKEQGVALAA